MKLRFVVNLFSLRICCATTVCFVGRRSAGVSLKDLDRTTRASQTAHLVRRCDRQSGVRLVVVWRFRNGLLIWRNALRREILGCGAGRAEIDPQGADSFPIPQLEDRSMRFVHSDLQSVSSGSGQQERTAQN